jgi:hypothetical protein
MTTQTEPKASKVLHLVALERLFIDNALIERGQSFHFDTTSRVEGGAPRKPPKQSAPFGTPLKAKPIAGDLKPKAAQAAVKVKAAEKSGGAPS